MSDASRREAERDAAGGDPQAAARLLVERVRAGDLPAERLELAAHLGDAAARLALGVTPAGRRLGPWLDELVRRWPGAPLLRVEVAALETIVAMRPRDATRDPATEQLVPILRSCLDGGLRPALEDALSLLGPWPEQGLLREDAGPLGVAREVAVDVRAGRTDRHRLGWVVARGLQAWRRMNWTGEAGPDPLPAAFLAALRPRVVAWALDGGRPA